MNNTILIGLVSVVALAVTTAYWRRRERIVRESLTVSRDWERNTNNVGQADLQAAREAARRLDAQVTDLPERIATLDEERRDLRRELDAVRERWADSWLSRSRLTAGDDPNVRVVAFDSWEHDDVRAFAKRAMKEEMITLVVATGDDSFAVAVGDPLVGAFSAADIASDITTEAGGGAGGNDRLAVGGGATGAVEEACRRVKTDLTQSATLRAVADTQDDEP